MFCTSLRKRPVWELVPSALLSLKSASQPWKESNLATHDIALPLSGQGPGVEAKKALLLLLSASDLVAEEATMKRIERLALLNGGDNVSIIFLLRERKDSRECMNEFMDLQSRLMKSDFSMHLIPLNSTLSLPATLTVFHQQLLQKKSSNPRASVKEQRSILATCSITGKDMKEHTVNVLCDVCHGFQDLAEWSTTKDGQKAIREYVPDRAELESALGFWNEEWIAE